MDVSRLERGMGGGWHWSPSPRWGKALFGLVRSRTWEIEHRGSYQAQHEPLGAEDAAAEEAPREGRQQGLVLETGRPGRHIQVDGPRVAALHTVLRVDEVPDGIRVPERRCDLGARRDAVAGCWGEAPV